MTSKDRQYNSMEKEIRKWLPVVGHQGISWKGKEGSFWGDGNVLSGGYIGRYNCQD